MFGMPQLQNEREKERKELEVKKTILKYFVYCASLKALSYATPYILEAVGMKE